MNEKQIRVGTGVFVRKDGKFLFGKRKGKHATDFWCAPGGHLEFGESWEENARRETREEAGIEIENVRYVTTTNDLYDDEKHYVTIFMLADWKAGEPQILEPDKMTEWGWFAWDALPEPLLLSTRNFIKSGYNPTNL